jgi:nascent polypeptide-associated complex subunit alpha
MIPGMNPRQMQQMMKKMGIAQQEIDATQVIIRTPSKTIYIDNPSVSRVNAMGQVTFQVVGEERSEANVSALTINDEDVNTVVSQTSCTPEQARQAIKDANGDLAAAILSIASKN